MLKIEGLTTGYGSRVLLRNVDASLERGELICRTIQHIVQALQVLLRGLVLVEQIHEEAV